MKAFRGEPSAALEEPAKSVRFENDASKAPADSKKNNFFANLGEKDMNVDCLPKPPTFNEGGTVPDNKLSDPKFGPKDACW